MSSLEEYTGPAKLILAFDIGTTFSGVSYSILEPGKIPEIHGVTRFPAQELVRGDAKVPSLLYYDKDGHVKAGGAEVLTEDNTHTALEEGWTKAEWWKLHLRPKHLASSINPKDDLPPLPTGKRAVDVLTDFIKYLFQCARTYILEHHTKFTWPSSEDSIEYIFTHPNGWEGVPQQLYLRAIESAGLISATREGRSRVHMLSEGEASLHFCVPNLLRADTADETDPQGVVIIDAGGGTVDLSMYSMTTNPISCDEIAPPECRLQGSVFVTRRARALIERRLEGWDHASEEEISEYTREFDQSSKLIIKSDKEPAYVRVSGRRYHNARYGIKFGKLQLSGEEATGLFKDSIDAIIGAFEQQEKHTKIPITVAFLVGGLSTNDWLWSQLQSYFEAKRVKICRPDNHINKAVANGAVLSHIDRKYHLIGKYAYWKREVAHKAEQLASALKQVEMLQKDLSTSASKLTDLETRFEAQSQELISTRDQLQKSQLRTEDLHSYYSNQLKHLKSTVKERQPQLFEVQRFVTLADEYAEGMIAQLLDGINEDIQGSTSLVAGYFVRDLQPVTEPTEEQTSALQRAGKSTGQTLMNHLQKNKSHDDVASYLTIALRAYLAYRARWIISSWTLDKGRDGVNDALDEIYEPLQNSETSTVAGRWRSLTRAYISASGISDPSTLVPATVDGLADIIVAAGCATSVSAVSSKLSMRFRHTISPVISAAVQLRKIVGSVVTSDFEPMTIPHPRTFNASTMEVVSNGKGPVRRIGQAAGQRVVLCTTSLGLMKRELLPEANQQTSILVKAKVVLEPLVDN